MDSASTDAIVCTAPSQLTSIDNLKVSASVANSGNKDVTILKYGTVLDNTHSTQSFTIAKGSDTVKFIGLKLQLDLNALDDSAYVTIKAGETVTVEHELFSVVAFSGLG